MFDHILLLAIQRFYNEIATRRLRRCDVASMRGNQLKRSFCRIVKQMLLQIRGNLQSGEVELREDQFHLKAIKAHQLFYAN